MTEQVLGSAALSHDVEAGILEQARDAFAQQDGVIGEHYAHAARALTREVERGKALGQPRHRELEDVLGLRQALELVNAQILEVETAVELLPGARREEHLPAVARLADPRGAVDVDSEVALRANRRLAGVNADPDANLDAVWPAVVHERLLCRNGGRDRAAGVLEDEKELVASAVHLMAVLGVDCLADEPPVIVEDTLVRVAQSLDEAGRRLHIREDQRDRSMRKFRHR